MISVLVPTRNRIAWLQRMVMSIRDTAINPVEVVAYVDSDDTESAVFCEEVLKIKHVVGPRIIMSDYWNKCLPLATSDILMLGSDDIVFRTNGWDSLVEDAFAKSNDKILFVYGSDGTTHRPNYGTHGFVHRKWVDAVGYFTPPFFCSDYADTWLNEVANALGCGLELPILIEHLHFAYGKAHLDSTYQERMDRHKTGKPEQIWKETEPKRLEDINKLRAIIELG